MLAVAKIVKSYGTDGGLLLSSNVDLESLDFKEPVFIVFDGLQVPFFILDYTPKGSKAIVHLNDVATLEDAEEIVGRTVYADADLEDDGELDFTGWTVYDRDRKIGICTGLEAIPGNPCLCVDGPTGEVLIPLHEDFILRADEGTQTLTLDLPAGLC